MLIENYPAQWQPDVRLTNDPALSMTSSNNQWCVASSGNVVHVVWWDERDGNYEIYYKRNQTGNSVGIKNISSEIPKEFSLSQNYPNPFNPTTNIKFDIPKVSFVKMIIYNSLGKEVTTLVNEKLSAGSYDVNWEGSGYSSGVYFYKLISDDFVDVKKMMLVK